MVGKILKKCVFTYLLAIKISFFGFHALEHFEPRIESQIISSYFSWELCISLPIFACCETHTLQIISGILILLSGSSNFY